MNNIILNNNVDLVLQETRIVKRYLDYIDVSDKSAETYKKGLKSFFLYMKSNGIKNPTREDLINYRELLKSDGHSLSTVNTYLISIRNFFKWLEYEKIYKDISKNIKGVTVSREHKREPLNKEQIALVLSNVENTKEKVIFLLGLCCGCRANEICNIQITDFVKRDGKILLYLLGKARDGKVDFVVVDNSLYDIILDYIKEYNITNYLITSDYKKDGSKVTNKTIRYIVKQMLRRVGIDDVRYSMHSCRHTFATMSIQNGADIRQVQQALRHKSLETSMIYLHDIDARNNPCGNIVSNIILN